MLRYAIQWLLAAVMALPALAHAQAPAPAPKVAILSLIGDEMNIVTYRPRTGTEGGLNYVEAIAMPSPVFDETAMQAARKAVQAVLPQASFVLLSVPLAKAEREQLDFVRNGRLVETAETVQRLKAAGVTHVLVIGKLKAPAHLRLKDIEVGSGTLQGIGYYIDRQLTTRNLETGATGVGFITTYAFMKLAWHDLADPGAFRQADVPANTSRSSGDTELGNDPWSAMTAQDKVSTLQSLITRELGRSVHDLLAR